MRKDPSFRSKSQLVIFSCRVGASGEAGRRQDGFEGIAAVAGDHRANDTRSLVAAGSEDFGILKCHYEFTEARSPEFARKFRAGLNNGEHFNHRR